MDPAALSAQLKDASKTEPRATAVLTDSKQDRDKDKDKLKHGIAPDKITIKANGVSYSAANVIGNGSFGVVFQAQVVGTTEVVAIKKVLQDKRFKVYPLSFLSAQFFLSMIRFNYFFSLHSSALCYLRGLISQRFANFALFSEP